MPETNDIPVYLFTGFLDSGKTKFINETLADKNFNKGEKTLVLLCEEGEEEVDLSKFGDSVTVETISDENSLSPDRLTSRFKRSGAERIIIEYNGMWQLNSLYYAIPDDWMIYQQIVFFDASTFEVYNSNMRSLVVDKIQNADLCVFNRLSKDEDFMPYHKAVRALSRQANIIYEEKDGTIRYDEIEDPLPFDINAPVVEIEDRDFALFYRDLTEDLSKYDGKTVRFKGVVAVNKKLPKNTVLIGRHVMTCCAADIAYNGMVCVTENAKNFLSYDWATVEGKIVIEKNKVYRDRGPVLYADSLVKCEPLSKDEQVATFY